MIYQAENWVRGKVYNEFGSKFWKSVTLLGEAHRKGIKNISYQPGK